MRVLERLFAAAPGESPLDLIYQAADDDMNSIGIDNSVETSTDTKTEAPQETTVPSTTVASTTTTEKTVPTTTMGQFHTELELGENSS